MDESSVQHNSQLSAMCLAVETGVAMTIFLVMKGPQDYFDGITINLASRLDNDTCSIFYHLPACPPNEDHESMKQHVFVWQPLVRADGDRQAS